VLTAFVDMNCTYCSELYARSRALIGTGQMRVRWIPVAVIHPDSMARAAALLQARDPVRALAAAHAKVLPDLRPPNPALQAEIAANNALLSAVTDGHAMTPMLLVQRDDGSFAANAGLPADLAQFAAGAPP
jgi:thiol:disulfide interchange protein DsbG